MIEELAIVVKIENHQVWVEAVANNACGGCRQQASCTTNAIGSVIKQKSVPVDCAFQLKLGDQVMVAIDENLLLHASLLLYLVPLIALFTSAGIADWLLTNKSINTELWVAGSAIAGFLMALWLINKMQHLLILDYYARPVVVKKL